jgi:hypothetical protein
MNSRDFEPFGERVSFEEGARNEGRASKWLMRLGAGIFWSLAGAIVIARAIYFVPGIFDSFDRAVAFLQNLPQSLPALI